MHNVIFPIQSSHHTPFWHNSNNHPFSFYHLASFLLFSHIYISKVPTSFAFFSFHLHSLLPFSSPAQIQPPLCTISSVPPEDTITSQFPTLLPTPAPASASFSHAFFHDTPRLLPAFPAYSE